jgi:hypothetical protein
LRLARAAPRTPSDLVVAIDRCLAFDPSDRWRNVRELHAALSDRVVRQRWGLRAIIARLMVRLRAWHTMVRIQRHGEAGRPEASAKTPLPPLYATDSNISQVSVLGASAIRRIGIDPNASVAGVVDGDAGTAGMADLDVPARAR